MSLDLARYQGLFYEVYRQNAYFEFLCKIQSYNQPSTVTANYTLLDKETLKVVNKCSSIYNGTISVEGTAKKDVNLPENQLVLTFDFQGNNTSSIYQIFYTDYDNFSIVGNLETEYLSFLSRTSFISDANYNLLCALAISYGFKINK